MSEGGESAALTELAKRRGFFFDSSEAYGGVGGFYAYGPQGTALKSNVEEAWHERFVVQEGNLEIEAPTVMLKPVLEASSHLDGFDDMLVGYAECDESHHADRPIEDNSELEDAEALFPEMAAEKTTDLGLVCLTCDTDLAGQSVKDFNLMFETNIDSGSSTPGYLRPETAQGIFVEFPRIKEYTRNSLPFDVTQVGHAYRSEISPWKSIVRTREFTQAELEHFIDPECDEADLSTAEDVEVLLYPATGQEADNGDYVGTTIGEAADDSVIDNAWLGYFLGIAQERYGMVGINMDRFRLRQRLADERTHYSLDCWDAESRVGGDWIEIAGFSYRSDYDLSKHGEYGDDDFAVFQQYDKPKAVKRAVADPDMVTLGPEFGAQAADVAKALEMLAEHDPDAFNADKVTLDINDKEITVDTDVANFAVGMQTEAGEHITLHVVGLSFGIDRTVYMLLAHTYETDEVDGEARSCLSLSPSVTPTNVGIFSLVSNVDGLVDLADDVTEELRAAGFAVVHDNSSSIGRRYRRQDEVDTPFCITIDRDGLEGDDAGAATIRGCGSGKQVRLLVDDLVGTPVGLRAGTASFDDTLDDNEVVEV